MLTLNTTLPAEQRTSAQIRDTIHLTLRIFIFALLLQLPALWYFSSPSSGRSLNWLLHMAGLLLLLLSQQTLRLNHLKVVLFILYFSYLSWVLLLWPGLTNTHYFYLLAVVIAGFVFTRSEKLAQTFVLSAALSLFCAFSLLLFPSQHPLALLQLSNDLTLGALSLGIYCILRRQALQRWTGLKGAHQQSLQALNRLVPHDPDHPQQYWQMGVTRYYSQVCVLFADLHGYTALNRHFGDRNTVNALDSVYSAIDNLTQTYPVEKIKTNGDQYIAISHLHSHFDDRSCLVMYRFAAELHGIISRFSRRYGLDCSVRMGIATGPVTAGIIGKNKPYFDIWGETVNLAAYLEQVARAGTLCICPQTAAKLPENLNHKEKTLTSVKHPNTTRYFELEIIS